jgi:hypothetical protein
MLGRGSERGPLRRRRAIQTRRGRPSSQHRDAIRTGLPSLPLHHMPVRRSESRYRHWHSDLSQAGRLSALLPVATLASAALSGPQRQAQS